MAAKKTFEKSGIEVEKIFRESKRQLKENALDPGSSPG